ncbi:hypothetical protein PVAP13_2NG578920 [Panicum virgatum]|uniref:Uncharacterized protein n=1 Tax=Panicum virgatum TaxID=38727 RepID=A0A8T0W0V9_PANVG|nr:hypothetical protein PVAP13_2NG578920 [Panicum virgatum]
MCLPEQDGGEVGRFWTKRAAAAASRARGSRAVRERRRRAGRQLDPAKPAAAHDTSEPAKQPAAAERSENENERASKAWPRGAQLPETGSRGRPGLDGVSRGARQGRRCATPPPAERGCGRGLVVPLARCRSQLGFARAMCVLVGWMPAVLRAAVAAAAARSSPAGGAREGELAKRRQLACPLFFSENRPVWLHTRPGFT